MPFYNFLQNNLRMDCRHRHVHDNYRHHLQQW